MSFLLFHGNTTCEIGLVVNKYITIEDVGKTHEHYYLYMPEYEESLSLITSDYALVEIIQDMDRIFGENGKQTNYARDYSKKYMTFY